MVLGITLAIVSLLILLYRSRFRRLGSAFLELIWASHTKCTSDTRLDGKAAIITGCNTGIGKSTAYEFCKRGARVIMACRNIEKGENAAQDIRKQTANLENAGSVEVKELDVSSFDSVRQFAKRILKTENQIHLLVNNAGIFSRPREITEDGYELHLATNHLGHFLLTILLLPRIISSAPSRIINVSSTWYKFGAMHFDDLNLERSYSSLKAYCRSKLANILFTSELAQKIEGTGVTTYSLHPGYVNTEISRDVDVSLNRISQRIRFGMFTYFLKTPEQGVQTTLHCSLDEQAGKENGLYYRECRPEELDEVARDEKSAKKLWDLSWKAVGLEKDYNPFIAG